MDKELLEYMSKIKNYYTTSEKLSAQQVVELFLKTEKDINYKEKIIKEYIQDNNSMQRNINQTQYQIDLDELQKWRNKNNAKFEVRAHFPITSHRKVIGNILIKGKKIIRKFLKWYIDPVVEQQNEFNGSVTASINAITNNDIVINQFIAEAVNNINDLTEMLEKANYKIAELEKTIEENNYLEEKINELNLKLEQQENILKEKIKLTNENLKNNNEKLESIIENNKLHVNEIIKIKESNIGEKIEEEVSKLTKLIEEHTVQINSDRENISYIIYRINKIKKDGIKVQLTEKQIENKSIEIENELDYFLFENKFRGDQKIIKKNQASYIKYFTNRKNVLDIGCGRGEFLELLNEKGIGATGIDIYENFVDYCKDKGLKVVNSDAIYYLNDIKDNALDGIFMSQVVEHLDSNYLIKLLSKAYQKLQAGAYLIAETPNPTNLTTFTNSFYLDPSHIKPVHPETFKFLLEYVGFKEIEIIYTESSRPDYRLPLIEGENIHNLEEVNSGLNCISNLLFGSLDYAVIAKK